MFVCLPPCFLCIEMAVSKKRTICFQLMLLGLGLCFTASCAYLTARNPGFFFYPAVFLCFFLLGGKILPVFIHTPEMKQFSTHLSHVECSFEASCQLVLVMHIWAAGGELHYGSMISSVVVIGKVSAENYLVAGPENLLADKSFAKRIALTLWYMPSLLSLPSSVAEPVSSTSLTTTASHPSPLSSPSSFSTATYLSITFSS